MRILIDYAHADLWESLALLFEDRLGWEIFRPIGMEWYEQGIWQFERASLGDVVARQFLQVETTDEIREGWSVRMGTTHARPFRLVTPEQAREIGVDLVISTLAENEEGLHAFASEIGAHFGIQIGNQGALNRWHLAEFALSSVELGFEPWKPTVTYHQEFSLQDFRIEPVPSDPDLVMTRVQCFTGVEEYKRFRRLAEMTPDLRWRHYGHCGERDDLWGGDAPSTAEVARQMRNAGILYHYKAWSDGYGHVIHNAFAVGRPVLVNMGYYRDKLAGRLMVDGVTCIDLDSHSDQDLADIVLALSVPGAGDRLGAAARARFEEVVPFEKEAEEIRSLLEGILSDRLVTA